MDILFALLLAVIGMSVVMLFLFALVLILMGLKHADRFIERWTGRKKISTAPRTKVAAEPKEAEPGADDEALAEAASKKKAEQEHEEEVRQLVSAAVAAYLLLRQKDAQRQSDKRRQRNVWSIAGKYEMFSKRLTGGKDYNF